MVARPKFLVLPLYFHCLLSVPCSSLADLNNGVYNCSLGDDGVSSYEDTCSFTCNTGYELTGSDSRTCQSDGSWNGTETMCTRGVLQCCIFVWYKFWCGVKISDLANGYKIANKYLTIFLSFAL